MIIIYGKSLTVTGGTGVKMDEDMNASEKIEELVKENRTWEILEILRECETLEEAKEKVKAFLKK